MPGLLERVLIEGVLLIIVVVCLVLAFMAIRKAGKRPAPPDALPPLNDQQLAHFDEVLQQREAELRQRREAEARAHQANAPRASESEKRQQT